jgi:hypothetical protein
MTASRTRRTETSDLSSGAEDKSLRPEQDKTLLSDGGATGDETDADSDNEPAADETPQVDPSAVQVEFRYHHGDYQPGDRAALPAREAANLVRQHRAAYCLDTA